MARKGRGYRGAKHQKERTRKARQEEKRQRRLDRRQGPKPAEGEIHPPEAFPPAPADDRPEP